MSLSRLRHLLLSCVLSCVALAACEAPQPGGDRALLIAAGDYLHDGYDLPGIDRDLAMMREIVDMLGYTDIRVLHDKTATLIGVEEALQDLIAVAPNQRVLIYLSLHGTQLTDKSGDEADGLDEALIPHDGLLHRGSPKQVMI